jgi:hypothetical protein
MQPITVSVGAVSANDQLVAASQNVVAAGALTLAAGAASIAYPAQLVLTTSANYTGVNFTITGTDPTGAVQTEVIAGPNSTTANSVLYYKSVTSIVSNGGVAGGAVKVGSTGLTSTRWVRFDSWANNNTVVQADVTGTANFTIQTSMDDPNDPFMPATITGMVWVNDPNFTGKSATTTGAFTATASFARVLQNSGSGSVTVRFAQFGNATY